QAQRPGPTKRQLAAGAGIAMGATLAATGTAQAADFTVNNLGDNGQGTLRQAILDANANSRPDPVVFQSGLSGTITPTTGELYVSEALQIVGPGAGQISVNGNNSRVFHVHPATHGDDVTISGLTITGGNTVANGGGIYSEYADLTVSDAVVTGNTITGTNN